MKNTNETKVKLAKGAVMGADVAEKELEAWHDFRKIKPKHRVSINEDTGKDNVREKLIEAFEYGELEFNQETGILKQKLQFPVTKEGGEVLLSELNWRPRYKDRDTIAPMKGVKPNDNFGIIRAYVSAITNTDKSIISSMDGADMGLAQSINNYFL